MKRRVVAVTPVAMELETQALHQPVRDFVQVRGKRLRGELVRLSYAIAGGRGELPEEISQAIEWLHAGSLVIDDVQDDSALRRGRPTLHRQIGVPLAINAGNYVYFRSLEILATSALPAEVRCQATALMIRYARLCHEGQAIDLAACVDRLSVNDWRSVVQAIAVQKTGMLVELAMRLGAVAADSNHTLAEELGRFGRQVGVALQMRNDLDEIAEVVRLVSGRCELSSESEFENQTTLRLRLLAGLRSDLPRMDDLRNRRMTWAWAWLSECCPAATCEQLAARLSAACQQQDETTLAAIAVELWLQVHELGEREVRQQVAEAVRLLGEHVLDAQALQTLRECLQPIERGTSTTGTVRDEYSVEIVQPQVAPSEVLP